MMLVSQMLLGESVTRRSMRGEQWEARLTSITRMCKGQQPLEIQRWQREPGMGRTERIVKEISLTLSLWKNTNLEERQTNCSSHLYLTYIKFPPCCLQTIIKTFLCVSSMTKLTFKKWKTDRKNVSAGSSSRVILQVAAPGKCDAWAFGFCKSVAEGQILQSLCLCGWDTSMGELMINQCMMNVISSA